MMTDMEGENRPLLSGAGDASAPQKGVEELPPPYSEGSAAPSAPNMPPPDATVPGELMLYRALL